MRALITAIKYKLQTIHPNPGPRNEEGRRRRTERRKKKRVEKRLKKQEAKEKSILVVTWNVQRMSLGTRNKRKAKSVAELAKKENWDIVLLSEVRAERNGVVWIGEGEDLTAIVFCKRAGILIRGHMVRKWGEGGQSVEFKERAIQIRINEFVFVSTYQPVYRGGNDVELEQAKAEVKELAGKARREDVLVIGGDFNAHVGGGEDRRGVCGKFGLRESNEQGRVLLDWCQENDLTHINSFFNHKWQGTWFSIPLKRWYELDGFIMRDNQRHKYVKKVWSMVDTSLSDHKPKVMRLEMEKKLQMKKRVKRKPRIKWERLRDPEVKRRYQEKIEEILEEREADEDANAELENTGWKEITEIVMPAAEEICGIQEKKIENPWMVLNEEAVQQMQERISNAINNRNDLMERNIQGQQLEEAKEELKVARRELQRNTRRFEKEWWEEKIEECNTASELGDQGRVYKLLKEIEGRGKTTAPNTTTITKEQFKDHFQSVSAERFENPPEEIEEVLENVPDISNTEKAREWRERLNETPSSEEIKIQMKKMRDSAPGEDGVRLCYLLEGGEAVMQMVFNMIQYMFENGADSWESTLKTGLVIPLHKKGNINDPHKFRGVCLLAMGSRILARIMADRVRIWAEALGLLDEEQAGFRKGRSTADVTQIMVRIQEDCVDLLRRTQAKGEPIPEDELPTARLLDLRKAYPRVNKHAMWCILEKYGMDGNALRVLKDLHESTAYKIRSREGDSEPWVPNRGLREGCPSSPPLFNIFHQVVMRLATKARKRKAEEMGLEAGLAFKWVPGSSFPSENSWEKGTNSEAKRICIDKGLFADDTTKIGKKRELEEGIKVTKAVMNSLEERNNDDKEEELFFGDPRGDKIRMLGSYIGVEEDTKQRIKRAGMAWGKVRKRLKGSKMSKRLQAKVVEACVESTMLFDSQTRTWQVRDMKRLQSVMDRIYRHIWSRKTMPPLMQMQAESVNMQDVRNQLGVKSIRWKIEKRVYERIGHIMRMEDTRQVKAVTLGWLEDLEEHEKLPGKKRKTVLYWKNILKEAGIDHTRINSLTSDRKNWKSIINKRMKFLEEWERKGGKLTLAERGSRNQVPDNDSLVCDFEGCGREFKSKGGLTIHRKRMHEVSKEKVMFTCELCQETFSQEANLKNHLKICTGLRASDPTKRKCDKCLNEYAKKSFSKHYKRCQTQQPSERPTVAARVYVSENVSCNRCGRVVTKSNLSKHQRGSMCR